MLKRGTARFMGVLLLLALSCSCAPIRSEKPVRARLDDTKVVAVADPASMTYRSPWLPSGQVTLVDGVFRESAAPGSTAELVVRLSGRPAFGTIDGKDMGVVILVTQAGGTGSFYDLALLNRAANGWANSDMVQLGDRVAIQDLAIRNNVVVVTMATHGPQDPLCCPTLRVERRFAVQGGKLVAAGKTALAPPPGIVGPVWQWVQTIYSNDSKTAPAKPESYTVQFGVDGTVNVKADCNRKGGRYSGKGQQIAIEITQSTMAACPEDSLEDTFVRDLLGGANWFLKDGDLYIDLKFDSGTMRLKK